MTDSPIRRIVREPALLLGVVTAGLSLALLFGVDLTTEQVGGIGLFIGSVMALLRFVLTPSSEVIAQLTPAGPVAGEAAEVATGAPVSVAVQPVARPKS